MGVGEKRAHNGSRCALVIALATRRSAVRFNLRAESGPQLMRKAVCQRKHKRHQATAKSDADDCWPDAVVGADVAIFLFHHDRYSSTKLRCAQRSDAAYQVI